MNKVIGARTYFNRIHHVLPKERLRLGQTLSLRLWPRSPEWISALEDLIALRTKDYRVAYQDVLQPINGHCPVLECSREIRRQERTILLSKHIN